MGDILQYVMGIYVECDFQRKEEIRPLTESIQDSFLLFLLELVFYCRRKARLLDWWTVDIPHLHYIVQVIREIFPTHCSKNNFKS